MPNQISWLLQDRVILSRFYGDVSEEGLHTFITTIYQYVEEGQPPLVHIISDSSEIGKFPMSLGSINKILRVDRPNPKVGWIIVVTANRPLTFISTMLAQIGKARFRTFKTLAEAIAFLNQIDVTLPPLTVPPATRDTES